MSRADEIFSNSSIQKNTVRFSLGTEMRRGDRIVPVFLPFLGCPGRCVFCAQDRQTGSRNEFSLHSALDAAADTLAAAAGRGEICELAFYGGTFTALPSYIRKECLDFLDEERNTGHVDRARCSTRPDALEGNILNELREHGIDLVELGVQSFSDDALKQSRRGYGTETAITACETLRDNGFLTGIQLLPGMPGCTPDIFLRDVETAAGLNPACMRFYPCLVPEGTELARMYKEGLYEPWSLPLTIQTLGMALSSAWEKNIPLIRLSVAPESAFDSTLAAGPRHPALGALIQAEALRITFMNAAAKLGSPPQRLALPRKCQGFVFGDRGSLRNFWHESGIYPGGIIFEDRTDGELS